MVQKAINHSIIAETSALLNLGAIAQNLRSVSFIRPQSSSSSTDSAISYTLEIAPAHTLDMGDGTVIVRPSRVNIINVTSLDATSAQKDAFSQGPLAARTLRKWPAVVLLYAKENRLAALIAAGASGVLISEVGLLLYAHMQTALTL